MIELPNNLDYFPIISHHLTARRVVWVRVAASVMPGCFSFSLRYERDASYVAADMVKMQIDI